MAGLMAASMVLRTVVKTVGYLAELKAGPLVVNLVVNLVVSMA